jgi:hypothetical protein
MIVVSDASPIISLAAVRQFDLLHKLYAEIIIPDAVRHEITRGGLSAAGTSEIEAADWMLAHTVKDRALVAALELELDAGEAEAIALAVETQAELLLMDERRGRRVAARLGCRVVGVLGVLVEAKQHEHLPAVRPILDQLGSEAGFRMSPALYERVLFAVDEAL